MRSAVLGMALVACASALAQPKAVDPQIERGRYIVRIAGCNDCHTRDYGMKNGQVDEVEWLTGDALGWRGPWGTTYPTNLRLYMQNYDEEQWLRKARSLEARPPMPWFNLRLMSETDLRAIYRYVRHLGPMGTAAPAYVPPGQTPPGPYVQFPAPPQLRVQGPVGKRQ